MANGKFQYLNEDGLRTFFKILDQDWWSGKWDTSWKSSIGSIITHDNSNNDLLTSGRVVTGISSSSNGKITYTTAPLNIKESIGTLNLDVLVKMNQLSTDASIEYPILSAPSNVKTGDVNESYYTGVTINPKTNTISTGWSTTEVGGGIYGYASAIGEYKDGKWEAVNLGSATVPIIIKDGKFVQGEVIPQGTITNITLYQGDGIKVTDSGSAITSSGERTISLDNHADTTNKYGVGSKTLYGHVKLFDGDSDTTNLEDGLATTVKHTHSQLEAKIQNISDKNISKFKWVDGTTSGPTANIILNDNSNIIVDAIPAANWDTDNNNSKSGVLLSCDQKINGTKDFFGLKENGVHLYEKYQAKGNYINSDDVITDTELESIFKEII